MKKLTILAVFLLLLSFPIAAGATPLGFAELNVIYSTPVINNLYLEYQGEVSSPTGSFTYTTPGYVEIFCVEDQSGINGTYEFHAIHDGNASDEIQRAAWIADNYNGNKISAQKAIWQIVGVDSPYDWITGDLIATQLYNDYLDMNHIQPIIGIWPQTLINRIISLLFPNQAF